MLRRPPAFAIGSSGVQGRRLLTVVSIAFFLTIFSVVECGAETNEQLSQILKSLSNLNRQVANIQSQVDALSEKPDPMDMTVQVCASTTITAARQEGIHFSAGIGIEDVAEAEAIVELDLDGGANTDIVVTACLADWEYAAPKGLTTKNAWGERKGYEGFFDKDQTVLTGEKLVDILRGHLVQAADYRGMSLNVLEGNIDAFLDAPIPIDPSTWQATKKTSDATPPTTGNEQDASLYEAALNGRSPTKANGSGVPAFVSYALSKAQPCKPGLCDHVGSLKDTMAQGTNNAHLLSWKSLIPTDQSTLTENKTGSNTEVFTKVSTASSSNDLAVWDRLGPNTIKALPGNIPTFSFSSLGKNPPCPPELCDEMGTLKDTMTKELDKVVTDADKVIKNAYNDLCNDVNKAFSSLNRLKVSYGGASIDFGSTRVVSGASFKLPAHLSVDHTTVGIGTKTVGDFNLTPFSSLPSSVCTRIASLTATSSADHKKKPDQTKKPKKKEGGLELCEETGFIQPCIEGEPGRPEHRFPHKSRE